MFVIFLPWAFLFSLLNIIKQWDVSAFISQCEWHSDAFGLKEFTDQKWQIPLGHHFFTQLPQTALHVSFLMYLSLTKPPVLSHVKNLKIETGTLSECNQVPLRRARGVLPFCLKQRKSNFPLGWKQSPSWLTSCWKRGLWLRDIFPSYSHTKSGFNAPFHFYVENVLSCSSGYIHHIVTI